MKKLLIAIVLITISQSAVMAQNETDDKRQFQFKTYLSTNYQSSIGQSLTLGTPIFALAWNNPGKSNFQELQTSFYFSRSEINISLLELRYSYNFAFPIGEKWMPYIGVGGQQGFQNHSHEMSSSQGRFASLTSLITTPGVQYKFNNKWALDFNIPFHLAEYEISNTTWNDNEYSYSGFNNVLGKKINFRLGVAYTF